MGKRRRIYRERITMEYNRLNDNAHSSTRAKLNADGQILCPECGTEYVTEGRPKFSHSYCVEYLRFPEPSEHSMHCDSGHTFFLRIQSSGGMTRLHTIYEGTWKRIDPDAPRKIPVWEE